MSSRGWITKLFRNLRHSRTSDAHRGSPRLQSQESPIQATDALQASSACHSDDFSAVGRKLHLYLLPGSSESSLDVLRLTGRYCAAMYLASHDD